MNKSDEDNIDWSLTTFEGARLVQLRRWSKLSLRDILLAQEEMQQLTDRLHQDRSPPSRTR